MNKKLSIILLVVVSLLPFSCSRVNVTEIKTESQKTFVLPASLQVIEEEAFSDTVAETVILPEGLLEIGDNAFEETPLNEVYIPNTTVHISESAFNNITDLMIHGVEGSYAQDWAEEHRIPFVEDDIWNAIICYDHLSDIQQLLLIRIFVFLLVLTVIGRYFDNARSRRPYDRPELRPIDYCFP